MHATLPLLVDTDFPPIARARLEALPEAAQCIDCKAADEARRPPDEQPVVSR